MRKDEIVKNICDRLVEDELITDYRYDHFREDEAVPLPFAVYRRVAPQNFSADNKVYYPGNNVDLEVYASDPDEMVEIMESISARLDEEELFYRIAADTAYIDSEDMYESLYEL